MQAITACSVIILQIEVHVTNVAHLNLFNDYQIGCDKTAIIAVVYLKPQSIVDLTYSMYSKKLATTSLVPNRELD